MKTKTFNTVFSVLAILFLGYSIICAILASHEEPDGIMPLYIVIWIVYALLFIAWMLYYGNKHEKKVYYLQDPVSDKFTAQDYVNSFGTTCTCTSCSQALKCKYAFDAYNIDGECFAEKCEFCHYPNGLHNSMCPNNIRNSDSYQYRIDQM
jgi:tellurite resistance protein TehA-like permease